MTADRIRIAIVDDHPALRDGTAVLLERENDLEVVGAVATLADARDLMAEARPPDVFVLDIRLAGERGLDLLAQLVSEGDSRPAVVIWTAFDLPQYSSYALEAGASGYVLKTAPLSDLVDAIRIAAAGGIRFGHASRTEQRPLSPREHEVLNHVVAGCSNDEIAAAMGVTTRAIEAHLTRLYQRHDLRSRAELAAKAVQEGWLELPSTPAPRARER